MAARLRAAGLAHAVIEGDFMGQVYPPPHDDPHCARLVERNLTAVWGNYAALGHRRLIYTDTLSVMPDNAAMFARALGPGARIVRVVLTASDATAFERLSARERGSELESELAAGVRKARLLREHAPADTTWVGTDGRLVRDIAADLLAATGWITRTS